MFLLLEFRLKVQMLKIVKFIYKISILINRLMQSLKIIQLWIYVVHFVYYRKYGS